MKQILTTLIFSIIGFTAFSQKDSLAGTKFQLKGKIIGNVQLPPDCGFVAWGTVMEFEVIKLVGMSYSNAGIGVIVTCPEVYGNNFF